MRIDVSAIPPERIVPEPEDVCSLCEGLGFIIEPDGGAGTARPCDCRKKNATARHLGAAGIPERYRRCTLENFQTSDRDPDRQRLLTHAKKVSLRYVEEFFDPKTQRFRDSGLIYVGPPGTGKTHLAAAVLTEIIKRYGARGRFVDFTSLVHQIQSTFDAGARESKDEIMRPVLETELLVLDELGARKPTEWGMDVLYYIINTRYTERRPTLFTTNYRLDAPTPRAAPRSPPAERRGGFAGSDASVARITSSIEELKQRPPAERFELLEERITPQLVSRVFEMAEPVALSAARDYRREVKRHRHRLGS